MTIAPISCHDCIHLIRGTSGGHQHDACLNQKNKAKLIAAEICRTAGWHETPAQAREKHVHQSLDDNRRALLELREGYQANQVARRALMGRKA